MTHQKHRGRALEGRKNYFSKRIVLVQWSSNKFLVYINKQAATNIAKTNKKENFFNMSFSHKIPWSELENVQPMLRKLFSAREISRLPLAERLKHFAETWKILTENSEILQLVEGIQNTFPQETSLTKNFRNTSRESRLKTPIISRNRQHVKEGSHVKNQSFKRGIFQQCIPRREEGRRKPSRNQLKAPEPIHTLPALQNKRLFWLKEIILI